MSGIDLQDQMQSYYPSHRKTIRWYKKVGLHICEMMLHNSYMLYNKYSGQKMSLLDYRESVIEALLPDIPDSAIQNQTSGKEPSTQHLPSKCEARSENNRRQRKRCRCCSKRGVRKDAMYFCKSCPDLPGLCLEPCFKEFHENLK
ncbi:unnamed protein product [Acanthoscelides obtectus]|uniref:PiggyBac transposable element-derived protein 4 C-terminal zinc-finger domain-containing protein n=1 Tax=Acanthoscelides obtectus TaxID=200917 RepID=A0A9P0PVK8_ACAOB|nr:unnamed protein product [Acanthoscelides obtectus]CAK1620384.1 PiggyBac transposable element-derived protein 4 [Acanthoscelides obtectus]